VQKLSKKKNLNKVANNLSEEIIGKSVLDLILMFKNYAKKCQGQKILSSMFTLLFHFLDLTSHPSLTDLKHTRGIYKICKI